MLVGAAVAAAQQGGQEGQGGQDGQGGRPHVLPEVTSEAERATPVARYSGDPLLVTLDWLGRFHPLIVHFPIALLFVACFAELMTMLDRRESYAELARFCLVFGTVAAVVATGLGWAAAEVGSYPTELRRSLLFHRWFGFATAGLALLSCWLGGRCRGETGTPARLRLYRIVLFSTGALVGLAGHFGARLVFGPDHFG